MCALDRAIGRQNGEVVELLLAHGAVIQASSWTMAHKPEITSMLLSKYPIGIVYLFSCLCYFFLETNLLSHIMMNQQLEKHQLELEFFGPLFRFAF